jgi:hypothetical protein
LLSADITRLAALLALLLPLSGCVSFGCRGYGGGFDRGFYCGVRIPA